MYAQCDLCGGGAAQVLRHGFVQPFPGDGEIVAGHGVDQPLDARPDAIGFLRQTKEGQVERHGLPVVA